MSERTKKAADLARENADVLARIWLPNGSLKGRNWLVGSISGEPAKASPSTSIRDCGRTLLIPITEAGIWWRYA